MRPGPRSADAFSVRRTAKSSSALMTAPPNSPTWFSWWSSTSSTEECCLVNSNTRAPPWPYDPPPTWSLTLTLSETTRTIVSVDSFGLYFCEKLVNRLIESLLSFFIYCQESDGDCWLPGFVLDAKVAHKFLQSHCHMHWCCCKIFHNHPALGHQCAWTQSADFYLFSWTIMWLPPLPESSHFIQTSSHILQTGGELIISLALHPSNWEMAFHGVTWPLFHHLTVRCCHRPLVAEARKDVSLRF